MIPKVSRGYILQPTPVNPGVTFRSGAILGFMMFTPIAVAKRGWEARLAVFTIPKISEQLGQC
jgi:hypothetical protein